MMVSKEVSYNMKVIAKSLHNDGLIIMVKKINLIE
jgi:hypothetical protein